MDTRAIVDIMASILIVAVVYMIVRDDKAQRVIKSVGDLFSGAIKAVVNGG
jgi:hypothetical protein